LDRTCYSIPIFFFLTIDDHADKQLAH
jgi:hypothetical protein